MTSVKDSMRKKSVKEPPILKNSGPKKIVLKTKPFTIPKQLFNQIDECSHGGYILLTLSDEGEPQVYTKFDNSIIALGLQRFASDYFDGVTNIHRQITQQQFSGQEDDEDDGMESDGFPVPP